MHCPLECMLALTHKKERIVYVNSGVVPMAAKILEAAHGALKKSNLFSRFALVSMLANRSPLKLP